MPSSNKFFDREEVLHLGRAAMAIFALIIAAAHLTYTTPSGSAPLTSHVSNSTAQHAPSAPGAMTFPELTFWFDIEIIAYTLIAVVFLLGLRTWYPLSVAFNAFNLGLYLLSGIIAIPGITNGAFGGHLNVSLALSTDNILVIAWIFALVISLVLLKYDPGSELDKLLVTKRTRN